MAGLQDDEDDDDFGDFEFAPPSLSSSLPYPNTIPIPKAAEAEAEDDDWGEFVESPLQFRPSYSSLPQSQSLSLDLFSDFHTSISNSSPSTKAQSTHLASDSNSASPTNAVKQWEKPRGAIPLSIFGDEEKQEEEEDGPPVLITHSFGARDAISPNLEMSVNFGSGGGFNDLILNLYGQNEQIKTGEGLRSGSADGNGGFDDNCWEFQDAETRGRDDDYSNEQIKTGEGLSSGLAAGNGDFDDNCWEFQDAETRGGDGDYSINTGEGLKLDLVDKDGDFDENSLEFKDAFSETGFRDGDFVKEQNFFEMSGFEAKENTVKSELQKEWIAADTLWAETKAPPSDFGFQGSKEMLENQGKTQSPSFSSNGKEESNDVFAAQNGFCHKLTTFTGNDINSFNPGSTNAFSNFISNLYNQAEQTPLRYAQRPTENGFSSSGSNLNSSVVNGDDDWEFKDSFSEAKTENQNSGFEAVDSNAKFSADLKLNDFEDFYSRLKEESCILVHRHVDVLKKAKEDAALSGEETRFTVLDKEIQVIYEKLLKENVASRKIHPEENLSGKSRIHELLEVLQEQNFRALDLEYNLSKRIPLAEVDLNSAVALLEHATSTLHIMTLVASIEEQSIYITTWSKMVSVCAQELQHGAMIWKQSCEKNVDKQIIFEPRGLQYFVALGEIYSVGEILRASATLYKPWLLANSVDSKNLFTHLEKCRSTWMDSRLKEALESILDSVDHECKEMINGLLESIKFIHELDELALRRYVLGPGRPICRLSLLPLGVLKEMTQVLWNGELYFLKLANLWANRLSCDPPRLPHIRLG